MAATGYEVASIAQAAKALDVYAQNSGATGDESVRLRQLKMWGDEKLSGGGSSSLTKQYSVSVSGYSGARVEYVSGGEVNSLTTSESSKQFDVDACSVVTLYGVTGPIYASMTGIGVIYPQSGQHSVYVAFPIEDGCSISLRSGMP